MNLTYVMVLSRMPTTSAAEGLCKAEMASDPSEIAWAVAEYAISDLAAAKVGGVKTGGRCED